MSHDKKSHGKRYKDDEIQKIIDRIYDEYFDNETAQPKTTLSSLAAKYGISMSTVRRRRRRIQFQSAPPKRPRGRPYKASEAYQKVKDFDALLEKGFTQEAAAQTLQTPLSTIYRWRNRQIRSEKKAEQLASQFTLWRRLEKLADINVFNSADTRGCPSSEHLALMAAQSSGVSASFLG